MTQIFASDDASQFSADELSNENVHDDKPERHVHVVILGTGFAGLGMAIQLKRRGYDDFLLIERSSDLGGTWRDNTYPGCACDVQSHLYSFSFALNPDWTHIYSPQSEIQQYLRRCARRFGILPHIRWNSTLLKAEWKEDEQRWHITTTQGKLTADFFILGNGPLNEQSFPNIPGLESFEGVLFHSSSWRHDYDLTGKRVAVIGTGASAIQFIPKIQPQVEHLTLFQRTAPWIVPRMDCEIPVWKRKMFRLLPFTQRMARARIYWEREFTALGLLGRDKLLEAGMKIAQQHLEAQVADPVLRQKLTPNYKMGCKRILLSDDFYPAVTQPNVAVVTERIREVRGKSVITADGVEHEVDAIICGTGFHVTETALSRLVYGRGGQSLAVAWRPHIHAYLGTAVAGFPNLFMLIGPNTGLGHNSMIFMIESQIAYILDCLRVMEKRDIQTVEVRGQAEESFNNELQERMKNTVWTSGCASWYLDSTGRNTTIWPGFTFQFRSKTRHFDEQQYELQPKEVPLPVGSAAVGRSGSK